MLNQAHTWTEADLFLMADEDIIEKSENANRRLCQIEKHPDPVIVPNRPWEGLAPNGKVDSLQDPFYGVVVFDPAEEIFKCWYNAYSRIVNRANYHPFANQGSSCCYAVSTDGVHWEKPSIREVLFDNSYDNNIVRFMEHSATHDTCVLAEQVWNVLPYGTPESEDRWVATLFTTYDDPIYHKGITVCFSPDGLRWRMHFPPVLPLDGDCHSLSVDPVNKCFLMTTRSHQHMNLCRRWNRQWKRHIALSKSRDLFHWTPMQTVLEADENDPDDTHLYLMYIIPYGHAYLGQLLVFNTNEMVLHEQLALSRDLERWQRVGNRMPLLERGPEGSWDSKHVALTNNPPHPEGDKMRFWYAGASAPHYQAGYGALGTGTLRRDGFVCWEAETKEGIITTIPMKPIGPTWILLNVDASKGEVLVEITDVDGNPIEGCKKDDCIPIKGNHIRAVVNFKAEPKDLFSRGNFMRFNQNVRLRFYLRNAKLYAFKAPNLQPQWHSA
ncbi:MAG: hypothetical protein QME62_05615 [Armatimonadota bacterium]|nr:hypothetical protein [Armatimonadota bacterium]